jgi:hypothetical protein
LESLLAPKGLSLPTVLKRSYLHTGHHPNDRPAGSRNRSQTRSLNPAIRSKIETLQIQRRSFTATLAVKVPRSRLGLLLRPYLFRNPSRQKMSDNTKNAELSANGWAAVPRSFSKSLADVDKHKQAEMSVDQAEPPNSDIAKKTQAFAKEQLPEKTFNHSMRVWYFGKQHVLVGTRR